VSDAPRPSGSAAPVRQRTAGGALARNTGYNLVGQLAPLAVAYFAIPVLTRELGPARFGLLTLAWAVLGYFSLFDLGLGRALTQAVADRLATGRERDVPELVWTGLAAMVLLGLVGGAVAAVLSPWLVGRALHVPPALHVEAAAAFLVLAASIPIVIVSAALRGVLEAAQRFDLVNAVRVPLGVFSFLGPVLVLPLSHSLAVSTAVLLVGRALATVAWYLCMLRVLPALARNRVVRRAAMAPLLRAGSWMTVSNVVSPLMVTLDRFVIGAVASVTLVAYYTAPWEAVTKLWLVPSALGAVLFPAFATARAGNPGQTRALYVRGVKCTLVALLPVTVVIIGFAREGLGAWLGPDYAVQSAAVLRWLAVGVLVNSVAQIPFALIQGSGRADVTARLHLAELPLYLVALWWLVSTHGIVGAAVAWSARAVLDGAALFVYAHRLAPVAWGAVRRTAALLVAGGGAAAILALSAQPAAAKLLIAGLVLAGCLAVAWLVALSDAERAGVRALPGRVRVRRRPLASGQ
jgi:O-antigen/teichoic acid export membrane protein